MQPVAAPPPNHKHNPEPPQDPKLNNRPSIVLIGIKKNARFNYMQKFQERVRLRFWHDSAENVHQLKAIAEKADMVFVSISGGGHTPIDILNSIHAPFQRVSGADSSMFDQINGYLERRAREHA